GVVGLLAVGLVGLVVGKAWLGQGEPRPEPDPFPVPAPSSSPFLNTAAGVQYVGSEACRACHADRHASFRDTPMGRSMAVVDPAREPPDGAFTHPPSTQ